MNSRIFALHGALAALTLTAACKKDPTAPEVGTPNKLSFELDARTVAVADSFRSFVILRDRLGNPLATPVTVASCNAAVAAVIPASDAPQVRTAFFVKGVAFNATSVCVTASARGFTDTMLVSTVPFSLAITGGPDSITSGTTGVFTFVYKDAKGFALVGVTNPTFAAGDTTIAQATATPATVAGRAPGLTVVTASGPGGVSGTKNLKVVPAAFTGTTTPRGVLPGAFLVVHGGPGQVFDANTAVSIGSIGTKYFPDSFSVRVSDVATNGVKSFTVSGIGASDVADTGSYTVGTPAAFGGTVTPSPVYPGATIWIHRAVGDPVMDTSMRAFRGTTAGNLAGLTVDTSTVRPDSFKTSISDVQAANTYLFQFTRRGAGLLAERGSYVLPVGAWAGTLTPSSGAPTNKIVLRQTGIGFDADTRFYFAGIRVLVDQFNADTAVVLIPPFGSTGTKSMRISRIGASQVAVDGANVLTSTTTVVLDAFDHADDTPINSVAITANGNYYRTMSGTCAAGGPLGVGVVGKASDDCDDYMKITNATAVAATVTVNANWFSGADVDVYICDGTALSNPVPNNVPFCGSWTAAGYDDVVSFDGASFGTAGGLGVPESTTFTLPAGKTYIIWANQFDAHGVAATLVQYQISGLP